MKKILLLDVGNSTSLIKVVDKNLQNLPHVIKTSSVCEFISKQKNFTHAIICSVVPSIDQTLKDILSSIKPTNLTFIDYSNIPFLKIKLPQPSQVGSDRLVTALAAYKKFKKSCLIIDSGTATTFCYVDRNGCYQGGAIFPGLGIASKALNDYTAKIPLIHVEQNENLYGKTTIEAVQIGLYQGFKAMLKGLIASYLEMDPDISIIGTGKGLELYKEELNLNEYNEFLILEGLQLCYQELYH